MACYGPHAKHFSHLDYLDLDRYYKNLSYDNNEPVPDPFVLHDAEYIVDVSKWPEMLYGNICCKLLVEAYNYYQSGFMPTIFYHPVNNSSRCCILKGKVSHGQRHSDPPVDAWILVNNDDCQIRAAHCTCMAGIEEAGSHTAAILFKVEASIREYIRTAHTENTNKWNNAYRKKINVNPLCELSLEAPKHTAKKRKMTSASTVNLDMSFDAFQNNIFPGATIFTSDIQLILKQALLLREKT